MRRSLLLLSAVVSLYLGLPPTSPAGENPPFAWRDGDRVVLIGDTLIERDQTYSDLETLITLQNPDKTITFRNLGWSGDTPSGIARARFGPPAEGFAHLKEHVLALKPTVLLIGYGMTSSFDGASGLPRFRQEMETLLDTVAPTKARVVLLSPIVHEGLGRPLPDPTKHNQDLKQYTETLASIAHQSGLRFVNLFESTSHAPGHLTDDGIHLTDTGARFFAREVIKARGSPDPGITDAPFPPEVEAVRRSIVEKNRLYFYRWRPQNETYLFGFRKREQGNNAREIPLFDPLVAEKEAEIARLKGPAARAMEGTSKASVR